MKEGDYIVTDALINRYGKLTMTIQLSKEGTDNIVIYSNITSKGMLMNNKNYDNAKKNIIYNAKIRYNHDNGYKYDSPIEYKILSEGITYEKKRGMKIKRDKKDPNNINVYELREENMKEINEKIKKAQDKYIIENKVPEKQQKDIKKAIAYGFKRAGKRKVSKIVKVYKEKKTSKKVFKENFMTSQADYRKLNKEQRKKYRSLPEKEKHGYAESIKKK